MKNLLGSFVIPAYNSAEWLNHAVSSCLAQVNTVKDKLVSNKDIEIVIVDDASTDSTPDYLAWLEKQGHKKLIIIRNEKNLGRSVSRNIGNRAASGDFLMVLDADDLAAPKRAELTAAKIKAGSVFVHGACHRMEALGHSLGEMPADVFNKDKALSELTNGIVHSTVGYTKDFAAKYPYQDGDVARLGLDDWACFLTAAMDGVRFDFIPTPLGAYRVGDGISLTRSESEVRKFKEGFVSAWKVPA